jgi:hypothetical protein
VSTATRQKAKPKVRMSTQTTDTGYSSKTPKACRGETEEHTLKTAVEHGGAQIEQARPLETTVEHPQAEEAQFLTVPELVARAKQKEHKHAGQHCLHREQKRNACSKCTKKKHCQWKATIRLLTQVGPDHRLCRLADHLLCHPSACSARLKTMMQRSTLTLHYEKSVEHMLAHWAAGHCLAF